MPGSFARVIARLKELARLSLERVFDRTPPNIIKWLARPGTQGQKSRKFDLCALHCLVIQRPVYTWEVFEVALPWSKQGWGLAHHND